MPLPRSFPVDAAIVKLQFLVEQTRRHIRNGACHHGDHNRVLPAVAQLHAEFLGWIAGSGRRSYKYD